MLALLLGLRVGQSRRARLAGRSPVEEGLGPDAVLGEVVLLVGRDHRQEFERYRPLVQAELRLGLADGLIPSEDKDVVEQVHLEVGALALRSTAPLQLTLVNELSVVVIQSEFL